MPEPNAERWKERANRVRLIAESMGHDPARAVLLEIAAQYEAAEMGYTITPKDVTSSIRVVGNPGVST
jgi:hypothetical protein